MGSVRLEESGEWSGGVPECRTAHAAHQQRVERGGRRAWREADAGQRSLVFGQGRQKNFRAKFASYCPFCQEQEN